MAIIHTGASVIPFSYSGTAVTRALDATLSSTTDSIKAIYVEATSAKTSSSTEGIRAEAIGNAASGTANIRGGNFKANMNASKVAGLIEGVLAHASVANGTIVGSSTTVKGLGAFVSSGAGLDIQHLYGATVLVQTRGDETISGNHVGLRIENEAVGGAGKEMGSAIQIVDTNVSADAFTVLIDASGAEISTSETDKSTLMSFKDSAGTTRYLKFDPTNATVVEVSTTAP